VTTYQVGVSDAMGLGEVGVGVGWYYNKVGLTYKRHHGTLVTAGSAAVVWFILYRTHSYCF
jgi:hypothetical protein